MENIKANLDHFFIKRKYCLPCDSDVLAHVLLGVLPHALAAPVEAKLLLLPQLV